MNKEERLKELLSGHSITPNEITLFVESLYWYKKYDDSNPDVGWGPSIDILIDRTIANTSIQINGIDRKQIHLQYKQRRNSE